MEYRVTQRIVKFGEERRKPHYDTNIGFEDKEDAYKFYDRIKDKRNIYKSFKRGETFIETQLVVDNKYLWEYHKCY
jgi:hypothetical protein